MRNQFIAGKAVGDKGKTVRGGRRRENFSHEREAELLKPFLESASHGGILVVGQIKPQLEAALGRTMALSSVYKLLHRHNWSKLARIKDTLKAILWPRMTGKKRHETLVEIRQNWAQGEPFRLMFQDEARFGRINDVRRCWAPRPVRPLCQGMLTHEYTYAYAAVEAKSGELDTLILPHVNTECMQLFLDEVGARHPNDKIVMVLDGAGWHASGSLKPP